MRTATKNIVGILSLGVLASSWSIGQSAETGLSVPAAPATNSSPEGVLPEESPAPAASSAPTGAVPTQSPSAAESATPAAAPTKKPSSSKQVQTGEIISYKFGAMQLEVVKSGSKISAVNLVQADTRGSDWAAVPAMLADAAVAANGSDFGNVSGATFTTQAFKSALESALAKF